MITREFLHSLLKNAIIFLACIGVGYMIVARTNIMDEMSSHFILGALMPIIFKTGRDYQKQYQ